MSLKLIEELDDAQEALPTAKAPAPDDGGMATKLLLTALTALSKRALVALAACQTLLAIGSVLFLGYKVLLLVNPSIIQVTGLAIYAVFVIVALWLARK